MIVVWLFSNGDNVRSSGQIVFSYSMLYLNISINGYIYVKYIFICQGWNVIDNLLNLEQISTLLWSDSPCNISCLLSCFFHGTVVMFGILRYVYSPKYVMQFVIPLIVYLTVHYTVTPYLLRYLTRSWSVSYICSDWGSL